MVGVDVKNRFTQPLTQSFFWKNEKRQLEAKQKSDKETDAEWEKLITIHYTHLDTIDFQNDFVSIYTDVAANFINY